MKTLLDLLPQLVCAVAVAAHAYLILEHGIQKEPLPMSEAPTETAGADTATDNTPPTNTATPAAPAAAAVAVNPVVQTVVQATQATQPPSNWATTAATVLAGLSQLEQPAFTLTRASTQTQSTVGLSIAALEVVLSAFFPHPAAA